MAYVFETHEGSASVAKDGSVTLTRTFRLYTGNAASRPTWGIVLIGIYKYNSHPDDPTCLATDVDSTPVSGELGWFDVTYTYSNRPFDAGTTDAAADPGQTDPTVQPDPVLRTPTAKWGSNTRMVPFTKDKSAQHFPVVNSAGQPFEGIEVEDHTGTITMTFFRPATLDICAKQQTYQNKVNENDFAPITLYSPYPAGTLKCNAWTGDLQFEPGWGWYIRCNVEFEYKWDGWKKEILDAGWYERFQSGLQYINRRFVDITTGVPVDAPVKLNGAGRELPQGDPPVYRTFQAYAEQSFTNIFT